jgi:hypothetical protein
MAGATAQLAWSVYVKFTFLMLFCYIYTINWQRSNRDVQQGGYNCCKQYEQ